jgi:hypothetical protein
MELASEKFKGIWPLYGGKGNYVLTLKRILEKICKENPTTDQLVSWLRTEYKSFSESVPSHVLRVVERNLGFIQKVGRQVSLTSSGEEFLKTNENRLVLDALQKRVLGFDEILSMLSKSPGLSLTEIHKGLVEKFNLDWKTTAQTMFRLAWLVSLGFAVEQHGKYHLTDKRIDVGKPAGRSEPSVSKPIDDYLRHATILIEKHPSMSEQNTISTLIEPLLEVLGWNIRDPDEVQRGYQIHVGEKLEYVDIALKINNRPVVFIEAKSVDTNLQDHLAEQPIKYANSEGVSWCVLTNGRELGIYNAFWKIKGIDQKRLFRLPIKDFNEKLDELMLLSKERVVSGRLDEEGESEHAKRIISEWLKQEENGIARDVMRLDPSLKEDCVRREIRRISRS